MKHGGIRVLGSYAYVAVRNWTAGEQGGLWIIDVTSPSNPQGIGFFVTPPEHHSFGVYVVDTLIYLAATDFYVIDVSDPSNPQQIGYCFTVAEAFGVHVSGSYAFVTHGAVGSNIGLRVIDVSDPTDPQEVSFCSTPNGPKRICISGDYAYIATSYGLRVIDISTPENPQEIGYYYTPYGMCGIYVLYPYVYMASYELGLQIFEDLVPGVEEEEIAVNSMRNNFFGATIFRGPLLLPEGKKCKVYDVTGRTVVPDKIKPGIYFVEIDGKIIRKVVKVR